MPCTPEETMRRLPDPALAKAADAAGPRTKDGTAECPSDAGALPGLLASPRSGAAR